MRYGKQERIPSTHDLPPLDGLARTPLVKTGLHKMKGTWRYKISILSFRLSWAIVAALLFGMVIGVGKIIGG